MAASDQSHNASWNPEEILSLLNLVNGETSSLTCVGYSPSMKRRCRNRIAQDNQERANNLLKDIPKINDPKKMLSHLHQIAECVLCVRYHQGQASQVASRWHAQIDGAREKYNDLNVLPVKLARNFQVQSIVAPEERRLEVRNDYNVNLRRASLELARQNEARLQADAEVQHQALERERLIRQAEKRARERAEREAKEAAAERIRQQEAAPLQTVQASACLDAAVREHEERESAGREPLEGEQSENGGIETPRSEDEGLNSDAEPSLEEEKHASTQAPEESDGYMPADDSSTQSDSEALEKTNTVDTIAALRAKLPYEIGNEKLTDRQISELEYQQWLKSRKAAMREREREEWDGAWRVYEQDWERMARIDTSKLNEDPRDSIPWPVKSGRWQDVTHGSVETFFEHAPDGQFKSLPRRTSLLMREAVRWTKLSCSTIGSKKVHRLTSVVVRVIDELLEDLEG